MRAHRSYSRWHGSFPWPKHVKKFVTFSLVSNKTSFFNTPAHHASLRNVIKGSAKISPVNNTPNAVKDGVHWQVADMNSWAWLGPQPMRALITHAG